MPSTDLALVSARPSLTVDGQASPALQSAVLALAIHLPADGMAHAELTLANWGVQADGAAGFAFNHLRLGSRLGIQWHDQPGFEGEITALEERYGDGAPRLVLLAEDALHRLARQRASRSWEAMSLDSLLQQAAQGAGLQADVQVDGASRDWLQHNESALAFLRRLLAPLAVPLRLQDGKLWARPEAADTQPMALNAGGNASQVRLIADLAQQPQTTVAQGFDLAAGEALRASAESDCLRAAAESAYRFMHAVAGDEPGFEEASRALFAADLPQLRAHVASWPCDIRQHLLALAQHAVPAVVVGAATAAQ